MTDECLHDYRPLGLHWWDDREPRPGSGATTIRYVHMFYCAHCLDTQTMPTDLSHDSYQKPQAGADPVTATDGDRLRKARR